MTGTHRFPLHVLLQGVCDVAGLPLADPLAPEEAALMGAATKAAFIAPCFAAGRSVSSFDLGWALEGKQTLPPWSSVFCSSQTGGRGQLRREWHSPPGNLYVSFLLPEEVPRLGDMASLYVACLVREGLLAMGIPVDLKWPNDILLRTREGHEGKFGGILLEERRGRLMAGLGLNLRSAPLDTVMRSDTATPAAALPEFSGTPCMFWRELLEQLHLCHDPASVHRGSRAIQDRVTACLAWKGLRVYAEEPGCTGVMEGIDPNGGLCLRTDKGLLVVRSGSIRLVA